MYIYIYIYIFIPTCYSWLLLIHPVVNGGSCDWNNGHPNSGAKRGNGESSIGKSMKIHYKMQDFRLSRLSTGG